VSRILICDWCKAGIQTKDVKGKLNLAAKGKAIEKLEYDLCSSCWKKVEDRLNSPMVPTVLSTESSPLDVPSKGRTSPATRKEWIDKVEAEEIPVDQPVATDVEAPTSTPKGRAARTTASKKEGVIDPKETNNKCPHYNKSKIVIPRDGKRPHQTCRDCGKILQYSTKELDTSIPKGVTFHDQN